MALQKQNVAIQFQGIDTKTDAKLLAPNKLVKLQNAVYRNGSINKREGFTSLDGTIQAGSRLYSLNDELLALGTQALRSWDASTESWINKGIIPNTSLKSSILTSGAPLTTLPLDEMFSSETGTDGTYILYTYELTLSSGGYHTYAGVIDYDTRQVVLEDTLIDSWTAGSPQNMGPKVVISGDNYYIVYRESATIKHRKYDPITNTFEAVATIVAAGVTGGATAHCFDAIGWITGIAISYFNTSNELVTLIRATNMVAVTSNTRSSLVSVANFTWVSINRCSTRSEIFVNYIESLSATSVNLYFYSISDSTAVDSIVPGAIKTITGMTVFYGFTGVCISGLYHLFFSTVEEGVRGYTYTISGATLSSEMSIARRDCNIASKAINMNLAPYILVFELATLSMTLIGFDKAAIASIANGSFKLNGPPLCANVSNISNTFYFNTIQVNKDLPLAQDVSNLAFHEVMYLDDQSCQAAVVNNVLYIAGATPYLYDSKSLTEVGFIQSPSVLSISRTGTGSIPTGTYSYKAVFEWIDAKGNFHRSVPSSVTTFVDGTGTSTFGVVVKNLNLTAKEGVRIILYRTIASGSVFYRVGSYGINQINAASQTISDSSTDATIQANELLYTEGGELENYPPPACKSIIFANKRLFMGGLENSNQWAYSKEILFGEGMQFPQEFIKDLSENATETDTGITGIGAMDGRVVLFKEKSIFVFGGDGPLPTGEQDTFSAPQLISTDTGAIGNRSIILMPNGLMFKSEKGVYLLDRSFDAKYIGADVESYNSATITSATMMPALNEVRFTTSASDCLVYNYYYGLWSTFTNYAAVSATLWQDQFTHLTSSGVSKVEVAGQYTDDGSAVNMVIETGWIKASGIQNYQRFYRALILGQYYSPHTIAMKIAYDYQPYYFETKTLTPFSEGSYAISSPLTGASRYDGTNDGVYQFRIHLAKQKCQAIKFQFTEANAATLGQGWAFTDLTLEVGLKQGTFKPIAGKQG